MKPEIVLAFEFVEYIPEQLKERTLYISRTYATAMHKCCCGCGREVVTPLSPTGWQLTFDGKSVSLHPSIGSWSLPCQSHYFIKKSRVVWAPQWTPEQIARGRAREGRVREGYFASTQSVGVEAASPVTSKPSQSLWHKIRKWFS
jgi:Family of unknown function (DUF6527)